MINNCPFDVTPFDQSSLIKNPNLVNINYTNQDFYSLRSRLVDYIKQKFPDNFNDFIESSLAIMLIEQWAFVADTLSFKIDQIANEIFIDTVSQVDNAFRLALLVGFKPTPPIASRSFWSATVNNLLSTDLIISTPVSISISTESGPKTIELFAADANNNPVFSDDIVISSGTFINTNIIGLEGQTRQQAETGDGSINQFYPINFGPVVWSSVQVAVDGSLWSQVDFFSDSQPRKEYRVEYDPNYNAFVIFGNGTAGLVPSPGSRILITYRTGGGVSGNIVTGAVQVQRNFTVPGFDFRVPVSFTNYTKGDFGYNGDGIDDIKRKLPAYLRTQNRAVTGADYATVANDFATPYSGSVGKATAVLRNYGCAANVIDVYILAKKGDQDLQEASNDLKVALKSQFDVVKMLTDYICLKDGVIVEVDVVVDVVLNKFYKKFEDEFRQKIINKLTIFFSLNNWDYGQPLRAMDVIKEISEIKEISTVSMTFTGDDPANSGELVTAKFFQIVRPSNFDVNFVYV